MKDYESNDLDGAAHFEQAEALPADVPSLSELAEPAKCSECDGDGYYDIRVPTTCAKCAGTGEEE